MSDKSQAKLKRVTLELREANHPGQVCDLCVINDNAEYLPCRHHEEGAPLFCGDLGYWAISEASNDPPHHPPAGGDAGGVRLSAQG